MVNVSPCVSLQLSQAAASVDNHVPTPGSVADTSSQQALPDMGTVETRAEPREDGTGGSGKKQMDIKSEVERRDANSLLDTVDGFSHRYI